MGLEAATWINDLVATNPVGATDKKSQGDDHIRLVKAVLQATFPNATKAFYLPKAAAKTIDFSVVIGDFDKTFVVDTVGAAVIATLPALGAGDDGWECHFLKTNVGLNALFIKPDSGTLQSGEISGLARCRRVIPGQRCSARWTGSNWFISRVPNLPVGSILEFCGAAAPIGYEFAYGQTLAAASTDYPEFYAVNGSSGVVPDDRGRVAAGQDDMGGASANRLTDLSGGINGDTLGAVGGAESHVLTEAQLATHTHTADVTDPGHNHSTTQMNENVFSNGNNPGVNGLADFTGSSDHQVNSNTTGITVTNVNAGSNVAHNNVQPTIIRNKIVVLE